MGLRSYRLTRAGVDAKPISNNRSRVMRSCSVLAIGRSLKWAVLPGAVALPLLVLPETELKAKELLESVNTAFGAPRAVFFPSGAVIEVRLTSYNVSVSAPASSLEPIGRARDQVAVGHLRSLKENTRLRALPMIIHAGASAPALGALLDENLGAYATLHENGEHCGTPGRSNRFDRLSSGIADEAYSSVPSAGVLAATEVRAAAQVHAKVPGIEVVEPSIAVAPKIVPDVAAALNLDDSVTSSSHLDQPNALMIPVAATAPAFAQGVGRTLPESRPERSLNSRTPPLQDQETWSSADDPLRGVSMALAVDSSSSALAKSAKTPVAGFAEMQNRSTYTPDAFVDQWGQMVIRLGAIVELLSEAFPPQELSRMMVSSASQSYLPLRVLHERGIPLVLRAQDDGLKIGFGSIQGSAQVASGSLGTAGSSSGATGGRLQASVTSALSAGFDSNPFLSANEDSEAASFRLQLMPVVESKGARTMIRASGRFEHVEYLGRYRSLQNYGADITGTYKATERLQLDAGLLLRSDILATDLTNSLTDGGITGPGTAGIPGGNDVTLLGQRQRRTEYGANAGLKYTLSERDEIGWLATYRGDRFGASQLSDSNFFSQEVRYSRQISERVGIGAVVNASIIDFPSAPFGDATTFTPQALIVAKIDERLKATGTLGVAVSRVELLTGKETNTALAGELSLCYGATLSSLCINGLRQVLPSAIGGARVQTTGGFSYSLRLSRRDTLQFGGNYSIAAAPLAVSGNEFESINVFGRYERMLNGRVKLFANAGYIDTSGDAGLEARNFQAVTGVSMTFGRKR